MKNIKKLTILHSNDLHGDFLQEQIGELNVGRVSMLSGYINKVRQHEENVIYAIAGEEVINRYKDITDRKYQRIITRFNKTLTHPQRNSETSLGNLFADIFKESLGIDIMFLGSGSIRGEKLGPIVEYGNIVEIFPYDDQIYMLKISGEQLKKTLIHVLRDDAFLGTTEFYQLSKGLRVVYSKSEKNLKELFFEDEEVLKDRYYTVGMQNFHFLNMEKFLDINPQELNGSQKPRILSTSSRDIILEYLSSHHKLNYKFKKRLIVLE